MQKVERHSGTVREYEDGWGFITTPSGDDVYFQRRHLRLDEKGVRLIPQIGSRATFVRIPIDKIDEQTGKKLRDQAVDIEVL